MPERFECTSLAKKALYKYSSFLSFPYTLQWDAPSPQNCPTHGDLDPHLRRGWFPGPTRVLNQNGISIGSASVTIGCIYVGSACNAA